MAQKSKLNLAISLLILLGIVWLIWTSGISIVVRLPLLIVAIIVIKWILRDKAKPARLLEFFVKTFALFLTSISIAYFVVWLSLTAPHTYSVYPVHVIIEMGMVFVLPISFLLEAIAIIIYGIYKIKLKAWEIFLSSWYVSVFIILTIYYVWWSIQWTPPSEEIYPPPHPSASLGAGIARLLTILQLSLIPAAICTIVYVKYKKPQTQKPT